MLNRIKNAESLVVGEKRGNESKAKKCLERHGSTGSPTSLLVDSITIKQPIIKLLLRCYLIQFYHSYFILFVRIYNPNHITVGY